jgi:hypothetical protein
MSSIAVCPIAFASILGGAVLWYFAWPAFSLSSLESEIDGCREVGQQFLSSQPLVSDLNRGLALACERCSDPLQFGSLNSMLTLVPTFVPTPAICA